MSFLRKGYIEEMADKELDEYIRHLEYFYKDTTRSAHQYREKLKEVRLIKENREGWSVS